MLGFGIQICFALKNGTQITFDGSGFQEAVTNFFLDWPSVTISPKELAAAPTVDTLITALANHVADGETMIFQQSNPIESQVVEETFDAYDFIRMLREHLTAMDDIATIAMELREYNELHFYRRYTFDRETGSYTGIELGTPETAEYAIGEYLDQSIFHFSDLADCQIVQRENLYRDSDPDDAYYGFTGCTVTQ